MNNRKKKVLSAGTEFTKVNPTPRNVYIRIEAVMPAGRSLPDTEVLEAVDDALERLQCDGAAEITEMYIVETSFDEGTEIIRQRAREGDTSANEQ